MAFLAPLIATAGAATATATAIGAGFQYASARKDRKAAKSQRAGQAASVAADVEKSKQDRQKKARLSKTKGGSLLTGSRGVIGAAPTAQKKLLGE